MTQQFSMDRGGQVEGDVLTHLLQQRGIDRSPLWEHAGLCGYVETEAEADQLNRLAEQLIAARAGIANGLQVADAMVLPSS